MLHFVDHHLEATFSCHYFTEMPEYDAALLKEVVCRLEDNSLENDKSRRQNYEILVKCLDDEVDVNISVVKKILNICEHDMKQNMKYTAFNLTIILKILERVKVM